MKTKNCCMVLTAVGSLLLTAVAGFAQGGLTPAGAPAPTMKTLDQLEPRTIVNAANTPGAPNDLFVITNADSYYLTTSLTGVSGKNGIAITANNVTLDLNGFTVQGVPGSLSGINILNSQTNITVRNGTLSGWVGSGVFSPFGTSFNIVLERLNASANGGFGIRAAGAGAVRDCNCQNNGSDGIYCIGGRICGCTVQNNLGAGIYAVSATVSGCTAQNNGSYGIYARSATVSGCLVENNTFFGIYVGPGSVSGCFVQGNMNSGIYVNAPGSEVIGNTCLGNNPNNSAVYAGIFINDAGNRIEDNHVTASGYAGIRVANSSSYTNNIIIKNSVIGNGANNYILPNAQIFGPLITTAGTITNSNPWANFSF